VKKVLATDDGQETPPGIKAFLARLMRPPGA
jgi:hypothetical protein